MRFRRRTPIERLEKVLVRMLERDLREDAPEFALIEWSMSANDGRLNLHVATQPAYRREPVVYSVPGGGPD
jgi:hypothetical protein